MFALGKFVVRSIVRQHHPRILSKTMVTLVVATTVDPASIGPASALLAMPGWQPGPSLRDGMESYVNGEVRLLKHDRSIIREDDLDRRWEDSTGEIVDETIFLSRHTAATNRPALTVHPIGVPHLGEDEVPPQGGKSGWAGMPNPRMGSWLRLLKRIADDHGLTPEFEITLEATHHGPIVTTPTMFVEIGSTEEYWKRQDAAQAIALLLWKGLGLDGSGGLGKWTRGSGRKKVLFGIGGGHYVPRHMDVILSKDDIWVGHLLSGYSLPMEAPVRQKMEESHGTDIGGRWKQAIEVSFASTRSAFPGGEIIAHLDQKKRALKDGRGMLLQTFYLSRTLWLGNRQISTDSSFSQPTLGVTFAVYLPTYLKKTDGPHSSPSSAIHRSPVRSL